MSNNKREKDRESGTGRPIKAIAPKGGSGQGNWGSDQQQIDRGVAEYESGNPQQSRFRKRGKGNEPANFGDLNPDEKNLPKKSWDEYKKEQGKKKSVTAYVDNKDQMKKIKEAHKFKKKYKPNKHEKETDKLFAGDNKKKSKNKKKKKRKVLLQTEVFYSDKNSGSRGSGRGRGGYANSMRGGGYQSRGRGGGGYRGGGRGYGGYGGGGYNRSGGGFGSRGRGNRSNYYDNNQNYQNQNQYQGGNNNNNNNQNDNVQQQITAQ